MIIWAQPSSLRPLAQTLKRNSGTVEAAWQKVGLAMIDSMKRYDRSRKA
jgi:hypothetical protein